MKMHRRVLTPIGLLVVLVGCCTTTTPRATTNLVELITVAPDIFLDVRYATANNFTGQVLYPSARCFLVREAAEALAAVQRDLRAQGCGLKVYDAYRPLSVQWRLWEIMPNPDFVADPRIGSRHNRGYAVDVSLVDKDGGDIPMPTEYDDFTERAHPDYADLPPDVIRNRALLRDTMIRHGFIPFPTEWWHFDFQGYEGKPNLDIPLSQLP